MNKLTIALLFAMIGVAMTSLVSCNKTNDDDSNTPINWVDLGLPSGLLWADCNLGAATPYELGDEFAWGETSTKNYYEYSWSSYCYSNESGLLTKYCNNPECGFDSFTDTLTWLESGDDAATAYLGERVRIPTKEEWQELMDNTNKEIIVSPTKGCKFTAANGNSIFMPMNWTGDGLYWSSSLDINAPNNARCFAFSDGWASYSYEGEPYSFMCVWCDERYKAHCVRAVCTQKKL